MAEQMRPASKELAPDPSDNYERSHPEHEAGMGQLDTNRKATPTKVPDHSPKTVTHAQDGSRQINAHDDINPHKPADVSSDIEAKEDEPLGWERTPRDLHDPRRHRKDD
jgi:hypothetical protein